MEAWDEGMHSIQIRSLLKEQAESDALDIILRIAKIEDYSFKQQKINRRKMNKLLKSQNIIKKLSDEARME